MQIQTFASFLEAHHRLSSDQLIADWEGFAFLLVAPKGQMPQLATLKIGDDERVLRGTPLPGIAAEQFTVSFHVGFQGWVLHALTETLVDGRLVVGGRMLLLNTGSQICSLRHSSTWVQFHSAAGLVQKLHMLSMNRRPPQTSASSPVGPSPDTTRELSSSENLQGEALTGSPLAS